MKYSEANKPEVCMMTQSTCYTQTRVFNPKGVLWHCTGANNPNLWRYVQPSDNDPRRDILLAKIGKNNYGSDWNHTYVEAGLNFWIGKLADGSVSTLQAMPWNFRPWGCGSGPKGSCNDTHIQFEICEDDLTNKDYFEACYKEACEMTAYLCKMYNIDPYGKVQCGGAVVPTILCHKDSNDYGVGGAHGDVYNWFNRYGRTMDDVRRDVAALLKGVPSAKPTPEPATKSSPEQFIEKIAPLVQKIAPKYGITCPSAVIAQACLESAYGTSNKAKYHNYFGLKYREGRLDCHSGVFTDSSSEQLPGGSYVPISTSWYKFDSMEKGVEGYFQFINTPNYANLKGISDPLNYLTRIRADGYATSLNYVTNVMSVVKKYNLTQYDTATPSPQPTPVPVPKRVPNITYAIKYDTGVSPEAKNGCLLGDGKSIIAIKIGVDVGSIEYRVHCGGRWLPKVSGNDWNDYENGYAGDDESAIDAIQIYYYSDPSMTDYYEAVYAVRVTSHYLPEVHDTNWEKTDGDNTAGIFGIPFDQIKISLEKC